MHDEIQNAIVIFYPAARKGSRSRSTSTDHSRSSTASSVRPHVPARIGGHGDSPEIPPGDSFTPESPPEEDKDFLLPAIHTGGPATRPVTHPVPHNPSSPGWVEVPSDTSVMPGSYVDLQCKSSLLHLKTVWFLNGPAGDYSLLSCTQSQNLQPWPLTDTGSSRDGRGGGDRV